MKGSMGDMVFTVTVGLESTSIACLSCSALRFVGAGDEARLSETSPTLTFSILMALSFSSSGRSKSPFTKASPSATRVPATKSVS